MNVDRTMLKQGKAKMTRVTSRLALARRRAGGDLRLIRNLHTVITKIKRVRGC